MTQHPFPRAGLRNRASGLARPGTLARAATQAAAPIQPRARIHPAAPTNPAARGRRAAAWALALSLVAGPAAAHHPMGGALPETFAQGLLSGIGHPILGFDHLAFVLAMGVAAAVAGRALSAPLAYIAAMVAGVALTLAGVALPGGEALVALSVLGIGAVVLSGVALAAPLALALFAAAGLVHGWALGGSIVGAEGGVIGAYLLGLAMVQYALAIGAGLGARALWGAAADAVPTRIAGAVVAGIGATFVIEGLEAALFGAVA